MPPPHTGRMSAIPSAAVTDKRLGSAAFRVLAALGRHGDKNGWCYPSLKLLAEDLSVTRQAISKSIQQLVVLGYVVSKEQHRTDGSRSVNLYRVILDYDESGPNTCQRQVDTPQCDVDTPQPLEVDTPQRSYVDTPQPLEVDAVTTHKNDPIRTTHVKVVSAVPRVTTATYHPDEAIQDLIATERPDLDYERTLSLWRDYHLERGTAIKDFDASFRRWFRGERQPAVTPFGGKQKSNAEAKWDRSLTVAMEWDAPERQAR